MKIYAHRGLSVEYPENTVPSFLKALEYPVDGIELDVRLTIDKKVAVIHDDCVSRTTNGYGKVSAMRLSDIKKLRTKVNGQETEIQVPTLEEVLDATLQHKKELQIELKETRALEPTLNTLHETTLTEQDYFFTSFDREAIAEARRAAPNVKRFLLLQPWNQKGYLEDLKVLGMLDPNISGTGAYGIGLEFRNISKRILIFTKLRYLLVGAYIVDDIDTAASLKGLGVDGIVTNRADLVNQDTLT